MSRADFHAYQVYAVSLPLAFYWAYRAFDLVELRLARTRPLMHPQWRVPRLVAAMIAPSASWPWRPASPADVSEQTFALPRAEVGISRHDRSRWDSATPKAIDPPSSDLEEVLDAYLKPEETIFDFSNNPALFHYLVERPQATRYFHVSMAIRERSQLDLIDELEESAPLVVFSSNAYGLPMWDGIPNQVRHYEVSEYLLEHYEPLLTVRGFLFMVRKGEIVPSPESLGVAIERGSRDG